MEIVDLHGMDYVEAKIFLKRYLDKIAKKGEREITVVHGHHGGKVLHDLVRKEFKHPRVTKVIWKVNPGETGYLIR
ncbi:MAG: Smr/MutS family protein [Erysipelotrichaceae bacterium]